MTSLAMPADREARLRALVADQFDFIWRILRRWGLSPADADDATQHVFMTATHKLESIAAGQERTYLYGIALRVAANVRRKQQRRREDPFESRAESRDDRPLPDAELERARARAFFDAVLAGMPTELARVLVLVELEELTLVETANLEGIPKGTVASRLRRARALFHELARERSHGTSDEEDA